MASEQPPVSEAHMRSRDLFHRLPFETIEYIFQQMSARDILTCAATCSLLKEVVDSSLTLSVIIGMAIEGFEITKNWRWPTNTNSLADADAPDVTSNQVGRYTGLTMVEFISEWEEYLENYMYLDHSSQVAILDRPTNKPKLIDGIWGYVTADRSYLVLLNPHLSNFPIIDAASRQNTTQSPGIVYGTDFSGSRYRREWRICDFTWDQSQDLLVLFPSKMGSGWNGEIHLRTLSADAPHPSARNSIFNSSRHPSWRVKSRIIGSYLIVNHRDTLEFYDWKAGKTIAIKEKVEDVTILTENLILVIFLDVETSDFANLGLVRLQDGAVLCRFNLPLSNPTWGLRFIEDSLHSCGGFTPTDTPYIYNPGADRVIVLRLGGVAPTMVISALHLLSYAPLLLSRLTQEVKSSESPEVSTRMVEWDEWGPAATRWFTGSLSVAVCGSRVLFTQVWEIHDEGMALFFNFNQRRVRRSKGQNSRRLDSGGDGKRGVIEDNSEETGTTTSTNNWSEDEQVDGGGEGKVQSSNLSQSNPTSVNPRDWIVRTARVLGEYDVTDAQVWELPVDRSKGQWTTTNIRCNYRLHVLRSSLRQDFETIQPIWDHTNS